VRWKVAGDEERESVWKMIRISSLRPFCKSDIPAALNQSSFELTTPHTDMLFTEPVVFSFSLWVSFSWGVLFLQFIAIPLVFTTQCNFTVERNGAVFAAVSIGSLIATFISIYQDKLALRLIKDREKYTPERRLYFSCVQSVLMPAGLFWFGWTAKPSIPWVVPTIAIACATIGIYSIYLATYNYLADTYHRYASSAIAAQSFCMFILSFHHFFLTRLLLPMANPLYPSPRPQHPRSDIPPRHEPHVQPSRLRAGVEPPWWNRKWHPAASASLFRDPYPYIVRSRSRSRRLTCSFPL
jgi:hypothetical protein